MYSFAESVFQTQTSKTEEMELVHLVDSRLDSIIVSLCVCKLGGPLAWMRLNQDLRGVESRQERKNVLPHVSFQSLGHF